MDNKRHQFPRIIYVFWDGFWPDFDIYNNQLLYLLRVSSPGLNIRSTPDPSLCDISIYSCYGNFQTLSLTHHSTRVLFLGENVRPSFCEFDYSFTSDLCDYSGRNTYLPLWFLHIDMLGSNYPDRSPISLSRFTEPWATQLPNDQRVVFIGNNQEPSRIHLLSQLRSLGFHVDEYGSQSNPVEDKQAVYSRYRYIVSPENSFYPGYITEKLIDSYISGRYFFYWGGLVHTQLSQPSSMIYLDLASQLSAHHILDLVLPTLHISSLDMPPLLTSAYCHDIFIKICSATHSIVKPYSRQS